MSQRPERSVLLIAYHFPPVQGSSGIQRTLRFAQHLPKFGWRPVVLTVSPSVYPAVAEGPGNEPPSDLEVHRARGLDAARHLRMFGRYPRALALPDRWMSWKWWAVPMGLRIVKAEGIDAIWSTFPIATAHSIGQAIARRTGLPWVAEFRDPMWQGSEYPPDPTTNRYWKAQEREIFRQAAAVVVTTPGAVDEYSDRYPEFCSARLHLIENGYDEEVFQRAGALAPGAQTAVKEGPGPVRLLHSGIVYPSERDPTQFFRAIAALKSAGAISTDTMQVTLRASANEARFQPDLDALEISDIVKLEPPIGYLPALQEMLETDALLILQASNCNAQIPAKLYEYLRADRPILALTDPEGDTARALDVAGAGRVARLDSQTDIEAALLQLIAEVHSGRWRRASVDKVKRCSREGRAGELASILNTLVGSDGH